MPPATRISYSNIENGLNIRCGSDYWRTITNTTGNNDIRAFSKSSSDTQTSQVRLGTDWLEAPFLEVLVVNDTPELLSLRDKAFNCTGDIVTFNPSDF